MFTESSCAGSTNLFAFDSESVSSVPTLFDFGLTPTGIFRFLFSPFWIISDDDGLPLVTQK